MCVEKDVGVQREMELREREETGERGERGESGDRRERRERRGKERGSGDTITPQCTPAVCSIRSHIGH